MSIFDAILILNKGSYQNGSKNIYDDVKLEMEKYDADIKNMLTDVVTDKIVTYVTTISFNASEVLKDTIKLIQSKTELSIKTEKLLFAKGYDLNYKFIKIKDIVPIDEYNNFFTEILINIMFDSNDNHAIKNMKEIIKNNSSILSNPIDYYKLYRIIATLVRLQKYSKMTIVISFFSEFIGKDKLKNIYLESLLCCNFNNNEISNMKQQIPEIAKLLTDSKPFMDLNIVTQKINSYNREYIKLALLMLELGLFGNKDDVVSDNDIIKLEKMCANDNTNDTTDNDIFKKQVKTKQPVYTTKRRYVKALDERDGNMAKFYTMLMTKFKYTSTQKIWDYCFDNNNNVVFGVISNLTIPTNIKFGSDYMEKACEHKNYAMIKFLLDQRVQPSDRDIQKLNLIATYENVNNIIELINTYASTKKVVVHVRTDAIFDIGNMSEEDVKLEKKKYFLKSNYSKLQKKSSELLLQKMFAFDVVDNIKKYIELHKIVPDYTCCECALFNEDNNVMFYVFDNCTYKPSMLTILKISNTNKRLYLVNKFYPDVCVCKDSDSKDSKDSKDNIQINWNIKQSDNLIKTVNHKNFVDFVNFDESCDNLQLEVESCSEEEIEERPKKVVKKKPVKALVSKKLIVK